MRSTDQSTHDNSAAGCLQTGCLAAPASEQDEHKEWVGDRDGSMDWGSRSRRLYDLRRGEYREAGDDVVFLSYK